MTCRAWTDGSNEGDQAGGDPRADCGENEMGRMGLYSEFVTELDRCLLGAEGWCASTGGDSRLLVWDVRAVMGK